MASAMEVRTWGNLRRASRIDVAIVKRHLMNRGESSEAAEAHAEENFVDNFELTLLRLETNPGPIQNPAHFRHFFAQAMIDRATDSWRKESRHRHDGEEAFANVLGFDPGQAEVDMRDLFGQVLLALAHLDDDDRELIEQRYLEGLTLREMCVLRKWRQDSTGTSYLHGEIHRVLGRLREMLGGDVDDLPCD